MDQDKRMQFQTIRNSDMHLATRIVMTVPLPFSQKFSVGESGLLITLHFDLSIFASFRPEHTFADSLDAAVMHALQ